MTRRYSSHGLALAAMLVFLLGVWLLPVDNSAGASGFVAEFIRLYGYVGSDDQRRAHQLAVLAILIFSVASFIRGARGEWVGRQPHAGPPLGIVSCVILATVWIVAYRFVALAPVIHGAAVLCILFLLFTVLAPRLQVVQVERAVAALIGAYVVLLIAPGLLVSPIAYLVSDADSLSQVETHLQWLPLRGSAIAAGQKFFREVPIGYGLLMPSVMSVADLRSGGLSLASLLRFVQGCQILFCVAAVAAYLAYRPRNYLGVLAALLLAGPYWASAGLGIWHPNQTGFRSLGLPVGMLALMLAGRLAPAQASWWLGAVLGVAVLMNVETAVAVAGGYAVFLIARTRTVPMRLFARMALAAMMMIVAYLVLYRLALGRNAFSLQSVDIFALLSRFSAGGFGLRLFASGHEREGYYLVPFALFMFAHAMYVVIEGFRRLGSGVLPLRAALRLAVAVTLIAWFAYYFNGPNWWQVWTHLFLYGFLIIDVIDRRRIGIALATGSSFKTRLARMRVAPGVLLLLLFLALLIPHTNRHLIKYEMEFMYPAWLGAGHDVKIVSGVLMPKDKAAALETKANKLKELHAGANGSLVYLTFNSAFMPHLTRLFQPAPYRDMFGEIPGDLAFKGVIEDLLKRRPKAILVDAPDGLLAVSGARKDYQDRIRTAIGSGYLLTDTVDGWQIWRPLDLKSR
jgi:hypothetical protein